MIRRSTWLTLGVFAVLLAFTAWWTQRGGSDQGEAEATPTLAAIWEVEPGSIVTIVVENLATGSVVEARRQAGAGWEIVRPEAGLADIGRLERAANWLAGPMPRAELAEPGDLSPYGLDDPGKRVVATLEDGRELVLEVGEEAPTGTVSYVRVSGRAEVLVMSKYGLSEVLGLLDPLPLVTPIATATSAPATATAVPSSPVTRTPTP